MSYLEYINWLNCFASECNCMNSVSRFKSDNRFVLTKSMEIASIVTSLAKETNIQHDPITKDVFEIMRLRL